LLSRLRPGSLERSGIRLGFAHSGKLIATLPCIVEYTTTDQWDSGIVEDEARDAHMTLDQRLGS
jgi:hypothetical protein